MGYYILTDLTNFFTLEVCTGRISSVLMQTNTLNRRGHHIEWCLSTKQPPKQPKTPSLQPILSPLIWQWVHERPKHFFEQENQGNSSIPYPHYHLDATSMCRKRKTLFAFGVHVYHMASYLHLFGVVSKFQLHTLWHVTWVAWLLHNTTKCVIKLYITRLKHFFRQS